MFGGGPNRLVGGGPWPPPGPYGSYGPESISISKPPKSVPIEIKAFSLPPERHRRNHWSCNNSCGQRETLNHNNHVWRAVEIAYNNASCMRDDLNNFLIIIWELLVQLVVLVVLHSSIRRKWSRTSVAGLAASGAQRCRSQSHLADDEVASTQLYLSPVVGCRSECKRREADSKAQSRKWCWSKLQERILFD